MGWSVETLKQAIDQVENALAALGKLKDKPAQAAEVEGQHMSWSDETLKQAIEQVENALAALGKLKDKPAQAADVEGQLGK